MMYFTWASNKKIYRFMYFNCFVLSPLDFLIGLLSHRIEMCPFHLYVLNVSDSWSYTQMKSMFGCRPHRPIYINIHCVKWEFFCWTFCNGRDLKRCFPKILTRLAKPLEQEKTLSNRPSWSVRTFQMNGM